MVTPLAWCAKCRLDPYVQALLGHHSTTGKSSADCYGRDNLAKPLREFETVLQGIRTPSFDPDSTRSGMMKDAEREDPSNNKMSDIGAFGATEDNEADLESCHRIHRHQSSLVTKTILVMQWWQ